MQRIRIGIIACLVLVAAPVVADTVDEAGNADAAEKAESLERLRQFTDDLTSFSARFEQTLYDEDDFPIREREGVAYLEKPGLFRWEYRTPYSQVIVSDGERLWMYESDLDQVTVRETDEALAQAPIMLLSGSAPLSDQFDVSGLGAREGLHWVQLEPKVKDMDFRRIYLGFDEESLRVMELRDRFDGATQVVFEETEVNPDIDPERFRFTPPDGADVIRADNGY